MKQLKCTVHPVTRLLISLTFLASAGLVACAPTADPADAVASSAPADDPSTYWSTPAPPGDFDRTAPLRVGFLIVDGVYNSELMAPYDVFHHTPFHTKPDPGMEVFTVSPDGAPVISFEGLEIGAHHSFEDHPPIDVLVVPSAEHSMDSDLENEAMITWLQEVAESARFVLSLCDGAFVLAKAGVLKGLDVTTFPGDQDRFAEMFPGLSLIRKVDFVHHKNAITSEGGAKSYQPAMYLVAHLYGDAVAKGVGGGLLIDWPPFAGTEQKNSAPVKALLQP